MTASDSVVFAECLATGHHLVRTLAAISMQNDRTTLANHGQPSFQRSRASRKVCSGNHVTAVDLLTNLRDQPAARGRPDKR